MSGSRSMSSSMNDLYSDAAVYSDTERQIAYFLESSQGNTRNPPQRRMITVRDLVAKGGDRERRGSPVSSSVGGDSPVVGTLAPAHTPVENSFLKTYIQDSQLYPLFDIMSDHARMRCFFKMVPLTAEPGALIEDVHQISHSIYIIEHGVVRVLTGDGTVMMEVSNGEVFGEMELVGEVRKVLSEFASANMSPLNSVTAADGTDSGPERQTAFQAVTTVKLWQLKIHDFCAAVGEDLSRNQEGLRFLFQLAEERRKVCICVVKVCICRKVCICVVKVCICRKVCICVVKVCICFNWLRSAARCAYV